MPHPTSAILFLVTVLVGLLALANAHGYMTSASTICSRISWLYGPGLAFPFCHEAPQLYIPSVLTSPAIDLSAFNSLALVDVSMISDHRFDIGTLEAYVSANQSPEGLHLAAQLNTYKFQAKKTIRGISKLGGSSDITLKSMDKTLTTFIDILTNFHASAHSLFALKKHRRAQQNRIDTLLIFLLTQLQSLLTGTHEILSDLDVCDAQLDQILGPTWRARRGQQQNTLGDEQGMILWSSGARFGGTDIHPAAKKAMDSFRAVVDGSIAARSIIQPVATQLEWIVRDLESSSHSHDKMSVVDMSDEDDVTRMIEKLQSVRKSVARRI